MTISSLKRSVLHKNVRKTFNSCTLGITQCQGNFGGCTLYVCMSLCITFESLIVESSLWPITTSSGDTSQVRIQRSSGQGHGNNSKKRRNSVFPQCKTPIGSKSRSIEDRSLRALWGL